MIREPHREPDPSPLHLGVADHLGWAVVVAASGDAQVADRRRIEMVGAGLPAAPIHHVGGPHAMHRSGEAVSDDDLVALIADVRASAAISIGNELDVLSSDLGRPIATLSIRSWPSDFPDDIATLRRVPYEARADPVMYRTLLAEAGRDRGWTIRTFDATTVEADARQAVGAMDEDVLGRPRAILGPPWTKDHRVALAAAITASLDV